MIVDDAPSMREFKRALLRWPLMPEVTEPLLGRNTSYSFDEHFYVNASWSEFASYADIAWEALWLATKASEA